MTINHAYRRPSGVYVLRLSVPRHLRAVVGRTEIHESTQCRDLATAKILIAARVAHWFTEFQRRSGKVPAMDLNQLLTGSPRLGTPGYLSLQGASEATGLDVEDLLREVEQERLSLFLRASQLQGHVVPADCLELDQPEGIYAIPGPSRMPPEATQTCHSGLLRVRGASAYATALLKGEKPVSVAFDLPGQSGSVFVPDADVLMRLESLELAAAEAEAVRLRFASAVTPQQLKKQSTAAAPKVNAKAKTLIADAIDLYMAHGKKGVSKNELERTKRDLMQFADLEGSPRICDINKDRVRKYVEVVLPKQPANEGRLKVLHGGFVPDELPRISVLEQRKRVRKIGVFFDWLIAEGYCEGRNPVDGLAKNIGLVVGERPKVSNPKESRDIFDSDELMQIFDCCDWFKAGRGAETASGTYREYRPYYYWLPLIALCTGARVNEICQLKLKDICLRDGIWVFEINDEGEKRLKNSASLRKIPIHQKLIDLGLLAWTDRLRSQGYEALFPELKPDPVHGHGRPAAKWFNDRLLKGKLMWERDGKKSFHSFRHTVVTHLQSDLKIEERTVSRIVGHQDGKTTASRVYDKGSLVELQKAIQKIDFDVFKGVVPFDAEAGIKSIESALKHKRRQ